MNKVTMATLLLAGTISAQSTSGWNLIWSDEFNGPANTLPDETKWTYDLGGGGWGPVPVFHPPVERVIVERV